MVPESLSWESCGVSVCKPQKMCVSSCYIITPRVFSLSSWSEVCLQQFINITVNYSLLWLQCLWLWVRSAVSLWLKVAHQMFRSEFGLKLHFHDEAKTFCLLTVCLFFFLVIWMEWKLFKLNAPYLYVQITKSICIEWTLVVAFIYSLEISNLTIIIQYETVSWLRCSVM